MYRSTIQTLTTIFTVMAMTITSYGQNVIYTFTFDNDLENWTTVGISSADATKAAAAVWVWAPNGDAGTGAFNSGETPIASPSGGGALLFDSDGLDNGGSTTNMGGGPAPSPQRGEITSPSLDFTGQNNVILAFNQFYRYFSKNDGDPIMADIDFVTPASSVEVSNDGGTTWTSFLINEDIQANTQTRTSDVVAVDISMVAGNKADVRVKFVWEGEYYFWLIDDVKFFDSRGIDFVVLDYTNIDNFETPDFALNTDSFDLEMMVVNNGDSNAVDSIMFLARILTFDTRDLVFSDTGWIEGLNVGDTVIWDFDRDWVPTDATQRAYIVAYSVRYRGDTILELITPDDNVDLNVFDVRDFSFRKVPPSGRAQGIKPSPEVEYDIANFFSLPESVAEPLVIDKISFRVCEDEDPVVGKTVIGFIVQLPDTAAVLKGVLLNGETNLIGLDAAQGLDQLIENNQVIGIGSYLFKSTDDASGCAEFFIDTITNLDGDDENVLLQPGGKYLVGMRFGPTAMDLFYGVNEDYKLWQLSTIISTPRDVTTGWGIFRNYELRAADVGLELELVTAIDERPLPVGSVKIYPNPTSDFVRVDLSFDAPTDLNVFIADALGKIIAMKSAKNVVTEEFTYDMNKYPSGNYIVRIATKEGTKTEHIVVTH